MKKLFRSRALKNLFLVLLVIGLIILPLIVHHGGEFSGADGKAAKLVGEMESGYQPWFKSFWKPPGGLRWRAFSFPCRLHWVVVL